MQRNGSAQLLKQQAWPVSQDGLQLNVCLQMPLAPASVQNKCTHTLTTLKHVMPARELTPSAALTLQVLKLSSLSTTREDLCSWEGFSQLCLQHAPVCSMKKESRCDQSDRGGHSYKLAPLSSLTCCTLTYSKLDKCIMTYFMRHRHALMRSTQSDATMYGMLVCIFLAAHIYC